MKTMRFRGFSKHLTWMYWRMRWILFFHTGRPRMGIVEVVSFDIPDDEWRQMVEANKGMDTSDYILVEGR